MNRSTLLSAVVFALLPSAAMAQEFRATIVGRVTDSTGAAIAGAKVSATNIETNANSFSTSGDTGDYTLPALSPGIYQLRVERDGFKTYIQSGITLQIQDRPAIDVQLEVGEAVVGFDAAVGRNLLRPGADDSLLAHLEQAANLFGHLRGKHLRVVIGGRVGRDGRWGLLRRGGSGSRASISQAARGGQTI